MRNYSQFLILLVFALMALWISSPYAIAMEYWVSPSGKDDNTGGQDHPVATLARAASLVQAARSQDPKTAVTVWLKSGDYSVTSGWVLGEADSGTQEAPVVWRAEEPGKARILGSVTVPGNLWKPVSDPALLSRISPVAQGHVMELDLAQSGLHPVAAFPDYANQPSIGVQLYYQGAGLPMSRWPNGPYGYTTMQHVLQNGGKGAGTGDAADGVFVYSGNEPARWLKALDEGGVWVRGFWRVPWVAQTLKVKEIDPVNSTISVITHDELGIGSKYSQVVGGVRVGDGKENWFALNLLEEIDTPGEWAVDFKRQRLYLWPPGDGEIAVSQQINPLITLDHAHDISFRGLSIGWTAGRGISIKGGDRIQVIGCQLEYIAQTAVVIDGGTAHNILGNNLESIGLSAIEVSGGDRATLTPCRDEICNNYLHQIALNSPVPAIIAGADAHHQNVVGVHIAHNRIDGASYGGITFAGNNNILEYNEIYRVGLDGGDLGAFYTTGGWTSRGNVVRYNFIHHSENANGIYMDDGDSGLEAYGNIIYKVSSALFIGGGHDNVLSHNLLVACERAIHVDDRGVSRKYSVDNPRLRGDFDSLPTQSPPWSDQYPALLNFLSTDPRIPSGNVLKENLAVACVTLARKSGTPENIATGYNFQDNAELPDESIFVSTDNLDFHLKDPDALTKAVPKFPLLPLDLIGLQVDENRLSVPERDLHQLQTESTSKRTFDSQQDVDSTRKTL